MFHLQVGTAACLGRFAGHGVMPEVVKIEDLPTLRDAGFTGGRDNLHAFCRTIFASGAPRYLRTDQNALVVFRHADLMAFGTAPQIGNVPPGVLYPGRMDAPTAAEAQPGKRVAEVLATQVFTTNPPIHGPTRRILLDWIGPKQISDMESLARNVASDIVGGLTSGSEIDFVPIVAEALIIGFWSRLLRLSDDEAEAIATAARDMTRLFIVNRSSDDLLALDRAFDDYARILDAAAARGLQHGDPALVEIERQLQTLDFEEDIYTVGVYPRTVGEVLSGNLIDGLPAALASANACYALSRHPDALEQARNSAPTLAKAIAEALRLEPPVLMLKRYALSNT